MGIIVQKFGGTSVADIGRIRHVATIVKRELDKNNKVVVVISAMSGVTNQLVKLASEVSGLTENEELAEYDSIVSTGEQVTSGLLALCLRSMGIAARSWLGWQINFSTDPTHSKARIKEINADLLHTSLDKNEVCIIPGFQGVSEEGRITTLGRGGSDTSAVAIAAALKADRCDIYTDVNGIYTTDPRIVSDARKLNKIGYEEMLELASVGAKVLQTRSVEMAMRYKVPLRVLSSFAKDEDQDNGTILVDEEEVMEKRLVTGVAYSKDEARITITNVENTPGVAADIFDNLAEQEINVDMIVQNITEQGNLTDMTFTVPKTDLIRAVQSIKKTDIKYQSLLKDKKVAKVSIVGVGMKSNPGIASTMFRTLADKGINILVISTSEIKISVLIQEEYLELAVRSLHSAFNMA